MITFNLKCGLLLATSSLLFACQHETVKAPAEFLVSAQQSQQLSGVIASVSAELTRYNYASFSDQKVSDTLGKYDSQIHDILNQEQWAEYDLHQRDYWAYKIYTKMKRRYQSDKSEYWSARSWSSEGGDNGGDRTDGTFGMNESKN